VEGKGFDQQSPKNQFAWQIFDAKVLHLLRPGYGIQRVTRG